MPAATSPVLTRKCGLPAPAVPVRWDTALAGPQGKLLDAAIEAATSYMSTIFIYSDWSLTYTVEFDADQRSAPPLAVRHIPVRLGRPQKGKVLPSLTDIPE